MGEWARWDFRRLLTATIALAITAAVTIVAVGFARGGVPKPGPLASVERVKKERVVFIEKHGVFLVSFRGELLALSDSAQHIGPLDVVEFCPTSELFESPAHGEKFDIRGYYFGGPARRGLDRYPLEVREGWIYVDLSHGIEGPPRGAGPPRDPVGPFCIP